MKRERTSSLFSNGNKLINNTTRDEINTSSIKNMKRKIDYKNNRIKRQKFRDLNFTPKNSSMDGLENHNLKYKNILTESENPLEVIKRNKNALNQKGVVTLDKRCYSCTNQNSIVLTAFKIACLGYYPTNINYRGEVFKRETLLQQKSKGIQKFWDKIKQLLPFGEDEMKIEKENKQEEMFMETGVQTA